MYKNINLKSGSVFTFILLLIIVSERLLSIYFSRPSFHSYPGEYHLGFSSAIKFIEEGIPRITHWENSSTGIDILNYMVLGKAIIDSALISILDLNLTSFYQTHIIEFLFLLCSLIFILNKLNIRNQIFVTLSIILLDNSFSNLIRPELGYGVALSLLASYLVLTHKENRGTIFLAGVLSILSVLFFAVLGVLAVLSICTFLLISYILREKEISHILLFILGQISCILIGLFWLLTGLGSEGLNDLFQVILAYLADGAKYKPDVEKILTYGKLFCSFFLPQYGPHFFSSLFILSLSNIGSFQYLCQANKKIFLFTVSSSIAFCLLAIVLPLHFYAERLVWFLPILFVSLYYNSLNKFKNCSTYLSLFSIYILGQQIIFHHVIKNLVEVEFYLLQVISTLLSIFALFIFYIFNTYFQNSVFLKSQVFRKNSFVYLIPVLFLFLCLNRESPIYIGKDFESNDGQAGKRLEELQKEVSRVLAEDRSIKSVITNWPIESIFLSSEEIHGHAFFMAHRKSRRFLTGMPIKTPDLVVLIRNKNSNLDNFLQSLDNFNARNNFYKSQFNYENHKTIFIKGYSFKLLSRSYTKNFEINYYKPIDIPHQKIDLYFEVWSEQVFKDYIKKIL